eukprot:6190272-Pleurochrysis_carterae.AAC.1
MEGFQGERGGGFALGKGVHRVCGRAACAPSSGVSGARPRCDPRVDLAADAALLHDPAQGAQGICGQQALSARIPLISPPTLLYPPSPPAPEQPLPRVSIVTSHPVYYNRCRFSRNRVGEFVRCHWRPMGGGRKLVEAGLETVGLRGARAAA